MVVRFGGSVCFFFCFSSLLGVELPLTMRDRLFCSQREACNLFATRAILFTNLRGGSDCCQLCTLVRSSTFPPLYRYSPRVSPLFLPLLFIFSPPSTLTGAPLLLSSSPSLFSPDVAPPSPSSLSPTPSCDVHSSDRIHEQAVPSTIAPFAAPSDGKSGEQTAGKSNNTR